MVDRFLAGYHPTLGRMGVWLSRPGIDVKFATLESQFLLSTDYKNYQVFLAGAVGISAGSSATVYFPEAIDTAPYVSFNESVEYSFNYYPFRLDLQPDYYDVVAYPSTGSVTFSNATPYGVIVHYRILSRGVGT